jgi:hypothetical protein
MSILTRVAVAPEIANCRRAFPHYLLIQLYHRVLQAKSYSGGISIKRM